MKRKIGIAAWIILWPLLIALLLYPIRYTDFRIGVILCVLGLWAGALLLWKKSLWVRTACLTMAVVAACFALLPGRTANPTTLRRAYVESLLPYRNTPYIWGGGNARGIDCSGLVERGLIDADFKQGFTTANPKLVRAGLSLWWYNRSAKALGDGYRGSTRLLLTTPNLNALDYVKLLPGDIAVTASGAHTLAYVGNRTWIEADPNMLYGDKVITVTVPTRNAWFRLPMRIMRWRQFETG